MHPKISKSPSKPQPTKPIAILGMMSGTSVDGIDGAVVISDGVSVERTGCTKKHEWHPKTRSRIFTAMEEMQASSSPASLLGRAEYTALAQTIAEEHAHLAKHLITHYGKPIKLIGFHGQTILHRPAERLSLQLGDAKTLAQATGIKTVHNFRQNDLALGGEGAPLAPIYHAELARLDGLAPPLAIANIGGVANVTLCMDDSVDDTGTLLAFDTGPGNGMMDRLMQQQRQLPFDKDGEVAASGTPDQGYINAVLDNPWFATPPPKSLDRFASEAMLLPQRLASLPLADALASLAEITAISLTRALSFAPIPPTTLLISGGGVHNRHLCGRIAHHAPCPLTSLATYGIDPDFVEAELIAFLAVRCLADLPITFPTTTGVATPQSGGVVVAP